MLGWITLATMLALLLSPPPASARAGTAPTQVVVDGSVEVTVSLDQATALIAQPMDLRLSVDAPAAADVTIIKLDDELGPFLVSEQRTRGPLPVEGQPNRRRWISTIRLESFQSGPQQIPPLEVVYRLPGTLVESRTIRTKPLAVTIHSDLGPQAEPSDFRDLKGVVESSPGQSPRTFRWFPWAIGVIVLVAAVGSMWWLLRKRPPQPQQWALQAVDQLQAGYQAGELAATEVVERLSVVVRRYIEAVEGIPATALASGELVTALSRTTWPADVRRTVERFLSEADELRFAAPRQLSSERVESLFQTVRGILSEPTAGPSRAGKTEGQ